MTGSDLYLMALGPALALLAGLLIYVIARLTHSSEQGKAVIRAAEGALDLVEKRKP